MRGAPGAGHLAQESLVRCTAWTNDGAEQAGGHTEASAAGEHAMHTHSQRHTQPAQHSSPHLSSPQLSAVRLAWAHTSACTWWYGIFQARRV